MAVTLTMNILSLGLLVCGLGTSPPEDQIDLEDAVVLLQGQVEVKRNEARVAAGQADMLQAGIVSSEASCQSAFGDCNGELQTSFDIKFPAPALEEGVAIAEATSVQERIDMPASKPTYGDATSKHSTEHVQQQASHMIFGTILEVLACLLIVDMVRRWSRKAKGEKSTQVKAASKARATRTSGVNPLLTAAIAANDKAFEAQFAENHHDLSQADSWGCTALHYAAKGGSAHIVRRVLGLGFQVDAIDAWDETPLHMAARAGCIEACATLLRAGANINTLNAQDHTPLIVAGRAGQQALCSLLLEHGAGAGGLADEDMPNMVATLIAQKVLMGALGVRPDTGSD